MGRNTQPTLLMFSMKITKGDSANQTATVQDNVINAESNIGQDQNVV